MSRIVLMMGGKPIKTADAENLASELSSANANSHDHILRCVRFSTVGEVEEHSVRIPVGEEGITLTELVEKAGVPLRGVEWRLRPSRTGLVVTYPAATVEMSKVVVPEDAVSRFPTPGSVITEPGVSKMLAGGGDGQRQNLTRSMAQAILSALWMIYHGAGKSAPVLAEVVDKFSAFRNGAYADIVAFALSGKPGSDKETMALGPAWPEPAKRGRKPKAEKAEQAGETEQASENTEQTVEVDAPPAEASA